MPEMTNPARVPLAVLNAEFADWRRQMAEKFPQHADLFGDDTPTLTPEGDPSVDLDLTQSETNPDTHSNSEEANKLQEADPIDEKPKKRSASRQAKRLILDALLRVIVLLLAMAILSGLKVGAGAALKLLA